MRRFRIIRRNKTRITFFDLSEMGQKVISGFISSDYNLFRIQLTKVFPWSKEWGVVKELNLARQSGSEEAILQAYLMMGITFRNYNNSTSIFCNMLVMKLKELMLANQEKELPWKESHNRESKTPFSASFRNCWPMP